MADEKPTGEERLIRDITKKPVTVTFEFVESAGRFQVCDSEGNEITVEAGKNFSTADPALIRELDAATHAVKRVTKQKET